MLVAKGKRAGGVLWLELVATTLLMVGRACALRDRAAAPMPIPSFRVVSREIGEGIEWGDVAEAFEPGSIVVVDEGSDVAGALLMGIEAVQSTVAAVLGSGVELVQAAVEALDHAVGLWPEGAGEAVGDEPSFYTRTVTPIRRQ